MQAGPSGRAVRRHLLNDGPGAGRRVFHIDPQPDFGWRGSGQPHVELTQRLTGKQRNLDIGRRGALPDDSQLNLITGLLAADQADKTQVIGQRDAPEVGDDITWLQACHGRGALRYHAANGHAGRSFTIQFRPHHRALWIDIAENQLAP